MKSGWKIFRIITLRSIITDTLLSHHAVMMLTACLLSCSKYMQPAGFVLYPMRAPGSHCH